MGISSNHTIYLIGSDATPDQSVLIDLDHALAKKFWEQYRKNAFELMRRKKRIDSKIKFNLDIIFDRQSKSEKKDKIKELEKIRIEELTADPKYFDENKKIVAQAFRQTCFDFHVAGKTYNGRRFPKSYRVVDVVSVSHQLSIYRPSAQVKKPHVKIICAEDYRKLKDYYQKELDKNPCAIDKRKAVMHLIAMADFLKVPRDLSGLNLSGCDLCGLDLRKTKFDNATMNSIRIDQFTKLKGSSFSDIKMDLLIVQQSHLDGSKSSEFMCNPISLLKSFKSESKKLRDKKAEKYKFFSAHIRDYFESFPVYDKRSVAEQLLSGIEHSEHRGRTHDAWRNTGDAALSEYKIRQQKDEKDKIAKKEADAANAAAAEKFDL